MPNSIPNPSLLGSQECERKALSLTDMIHYLFYVNDVLIYKNRAYRDMKFLHAKYSAG